MNASKLQPVYALCVRRTGRYDIQCGIAPSANIECREFSRGRLSFPGSQNIVLTIPIAAWERRCLSLVRRPYACDIGERQVRARLPIVSSQAQT